MQTFFHGQPKDMPGIDLRQASNRSKCPTYFAKEEETGMEKQKLVMQEMAKLLKARFIKEIHFIT